MQTVHRIDVRANIAYAVKEYLLLDYMLHLKDPEIVSIEAVEDGQFNNHFVVTVQDCLKNCTLHAWFQSSSEEAPAIEEFYPDFFFDETDTADGTVYIKEYFNLRPEVLNYILQIYFSMPKECATGRLEIIDISTNEEYIVKEIMALVANYDQYGRAISYIYIGSNKEAYRNSVAVQVYHGIFRVWEVISQ